MAEKKNPPPNELRSLTLVDVIRYLVVGLLINVIVSYYVTGTPLWGRQTKLTNIRYVKFAAIHYATVASSQGSDDGYIHFSDKKLAQYNGQDPLLPIYVAVNGTVYDVSSSPHTYGPGGAYSFFSGRDAARAFVTGCFQSDLTHDLRGLDLDKANEQLQGWQRFYENSHKYWKVGYVEHEPLTGNPPPLCAAAQAPGGVH